MVIGSLVDAKRDAQDTSKCSDPCGGRIGLRGHCRTVRRERTGGCDGGGVQVARRCRSPNFYLWQQAGSVRRTPTDGSRQIPAIRWMSAIQWQTTLGSTMIHNLRSPEIQCRSPLDSRNVNHHYTVQKFQDHRRHVRSQFVIRRTMNGMRTWA